MGDCCLPLSDPFVSITIIRYYSIMIIRYFSITIIRYYSITIIRYYSITIIRYYSITIIRYYSITIIRYFSMRRWWCPLCTLRENLAPCFWWVPCCSSFWFPVLSCLESDFCTCFVCLRPVSSSRKQCSSNRHVALFESIFLIQAK